MMILRYLLEKEFKQFMRNPFLPRLVLVFPVMVLLVMPWVTTMDIRQVNVGVVDLDRSTLSRQLIRDFSHTDYLRLQAMPASYDEALRHIEAGMLDVVVEIPDGFDKAVARREPAVLQLSVNAVNGMKGAMGSNYVSAVAMQTLRTHVAEQGLSVPDEALTVRNLYNETEEYRYFMIPALMVVLLIMLCGFLPALNVVGEKEGGTIEQINVTPVSRLTFTLAKLIPYWLIGFVVLTIGMGLAAWVYGLTPAGGIWIIYLAAVLFVLAMSGAGLIISNYSSTYQQAMFVTLFFVMFFMLMSGLFTPIESMPDWARALTTVIPPRYFIEVMRGVYLRGCLLSDLGVQFGALALCALALNLWAAFSYRKQE